MHIFRNPVKDHAFEFHVSRSDTIQRGCNNGNKDEVNFRRFLYALLSGNSFIDEVTVENLN